MFLKCSTNIFDSSLKIYTQIDNQLIKFDLTKLYSSITKKVNSLIFAKRFTPITDNDQKLIYYIPGSLQYFTKIKHGKNKPLLSF